MKRLLDSNILIYAVRPEFAELRRWLAGPASVSAISIVEVLGYAGLTDEDAAAFEAWFAMLDLRQVTETILRRAAALRRVRRMKLGDSIIAATALETGAKLVTRNVDDFRHIAGLEITNPFASPGES